MDNMFKKKAIYFTQGTAPTEADSAAARALMFKLEARVVFRNGGIDEGGGRPEKCDFVAGPRIPDIYRKVATVVDEAGNVIGKPVLSREALVTVSPETGSPPTAKDTEAEKIAREVGAVPSATGWGAKAPV
jgi:hypothetical protein